MECEGHIQKRLGKRLRDQKKKTFVDDSGQVRKIKGGGKGRLTESDINSLSVYFGGAICNFPGDVDGMFRANWAVFTTQYLMMSSMTICFARQDQWWMTAQIALYIPSTSLGKFLMASP